MRTPKTPDKIQQTQFSKFLPEYVEYAERIRKTLYYGRLPSTDRPSLPFTNMSVEKFSRWCRQDGLEKLDVRYASSVCYEACVTPCSLVLALVYLERLRASNPDYLAKAPPSQVFLVAMMVASKYLYDDGEEDEVFNDEWATSAALPLADLNKAEREFLMAIDWNLFVDADVFLRAFERVEGEVAWREGERRGYFTYSDLATLSHILPGSCTAVLNLLSHMVAVCMVSYTAAIMTVVAGTLLAHECSHTLSSTLTRWTSSSLLHQPQVLPANDSLLGPVMHREEALAEVLDVFASEVENAEEGNVSVAGSRAITTLTTSIILAMSYSKPRQHQYLTRQEEEEEEDCPDAQEEIRKRRKTYNARPYAQDDYLDFDPTDLRLSFTTGSYWPPTSRKQDGALLNMKSQGRPSEDPPLRFWPYGPPTLSHDSPIFLGNFSGIGAPNLYGGGGLDGRAGGLVEWLSWVSQGLGEVLDDLGDLLVTEAMPPPTFSSRVAVACS